MTLGWTVKPSGIATKASPGAIARQVPGRDMELADYRERLDFMASTQQLVPRIRIDRGPRGLGKTSMLRAAEHIAENEFRALSVWVPGC